MKFLLSLFLATAAATSASKTIPGDAVIKADSEIGMKLLSQARQLEQEDEEVDMSWIVGYSLKFQGCHHVKQWNGDADGDEDVKIETKRLIRFRLCPSDTCTATAAGGCKSGYGDYVLDLNTYINAYYELKEQITEKACENHMNNNCDCDDDDGKGDDFNREYCEYDCFVDAGMSECVDRNPYEDDEVEKIEVEKYLECAQLEYEQDENRKLEEEEEEEEVAYFVGPYCAKQGGDVYLGVFTEDSCSEFADDYGGKSTFESLTGQTLPYSSESLVGMDCVSTQEVNDDGEVGLYEQVQELYQAAGKCEDNLEYGTVDEPNSNACSYIAGVKIVREDGVVRSSNGRSNPVATAFIVIFAMAFVAMAFYVYYLRTKMGGVGKEPLMG